MPRHVCWVVYSILALVGAVLLVLPRSAPSFPHGSTKIFQGVAFHAETLSNSTEGRGHLYTAVIDLRAPGIELYVTPLDVSALAKGWHYRLRRISEVVESERLSVVINGPMFSSDPPFWIHMPGDMANSAYGTLVADHVVADVQNHSDVLWFDDQLEPHLRPWNPSLRAKELAPAKWAIGGSIVLRDGAISAPGEQRRDSRTMIGVDRRHHLFLAVAQDISPRLLAEKLAEQGAEDAIILDGGTSSAMAVGQGAVGIGPGVLWGGWRPVATYFGIRAAPLVGQDQHK
jgi:hypothetical protein